MHNILAKHLHLRAYKMQLLQVLKLIGQVKCINFSVNMLERIDATHDFFHKVCFSD
jgi:hypothetical protein